MEPIVADEMRRRSAMFWGRRVVVGSWPIEPKGFTFLGNAVHLVGKVLFDDWQGNEPAFSRYPLLDGQRTYQADGFDAVFATWVLQNFDPTTSDDFMQTVEHRWSRSTDPLTEKQWETAIELFKEKLAWFHNLARYRMAKVVRAITEAAAQEELSLFTRSETTGEFSPSPAALWCVEQAAYARFNECQMSPAAPHHLLVPHIFDVAMPSKLPPDVLPGNEWIFVTTGSLESFLAALSKRQAPRATADRSPKAKASATAVAEWARRYFAEFTEPVAPGWDVALHAFQERFPSAPSTQFRDKVWPTRPSWMPRKHRAKKG